MIAIPLSRSVVPTPGGSTRGLLWILLPAVAAWPLWGWSARRLQDGSDDPLGIVALVVLLACVVRDRQRLQPSPRLGWLALSLAATLAAVGMSAWLSPLPRAVMAVAGLLLASAAVQGPGVPLAAWGGLGLLALPVLSSLQFFAGFPLRVVTAAATTALLQGAGLQVVRRGTALEIAGRLVLVDAPCSGVQMGWMAYFTACAAAAWLRMPDRRFLRRLPGIGLWVLAGNIVRNTVLVVLESGSLQGPAWLHSAVGLLVFAVVCLAVLGQVARGSAGLGLAAQGKPGLGQATLPVPPPFKRTAIRAATVSFAGCALLSLHPGLARGPHPRPQCPVEWPHTWDGRTLRPLALSAVELRFAEQFPGAIGRFTDGQRIVTLRQVDAPTRKLHPSADCYRGLGYRIERIGLEQQVGRTGGTDLQRCFTAVLRTDRQRVCEAIEAPDGQRFTDTSAWYWAAVTGASAGPWRAVTVAQAE